MVKVLRCEQADGEYFDQMIGNFVILKGEYLGRRHNMRQANSRIIRSHIKWRQQYASISCFRKAAFANGIFLRKPYIVPLTQVLVHSGTRIH